MFDREEPQDWGPNNDLKRSRAARSLAFSWWKAVGGKGVVVVVVVGKLFG